MTNYRRPPDDEDPGDAGTRRSGRARSSRHSAWSEMAGQEPPDRYGADAAGRRPGYVRRPPDADGTGRRSTSYPSYSSRYGGPPPTRPGGRGGRGEPPQRRRRSAATIVGRIVSTLVALVLLVVSGAAWAAVGGKPHNASNATEQAGTVGVAPRTTTDAAGNVVKVAGTGMNILIVGSDARTDADGNPLTPTELKAVSTQLDGGGVSTDTIMIVHVPGNGTKATAISIPRDSWIPDSVAQAPDVVGPYSDGTQGHYRANKVNSYYGTAKAYEADYLVSHGVSDRAEIERKSNEAGRTMLIKVLQQFTGVKIDHYAEVNLIGFYLLSKAIGGVPVCLVKATKDRQSGADFPAGHFDVQGSSALSFVRQRHGLPAGDLDRIKRQQAFLASAANKILSVGTLTNPARLAALVDAVNRSVVLDSGFNLLSFAQQMMALTSGNINFVTISTQGTEMIDGMSALKVDPAQVRAQFARLATDATSTPTTSAAPTSVDRANVTVDVQNGTETSGMAAMVGAEIAAAGFQRGQLTDYPGVTPNDQQRQTTVRYPAGGEAAAAAVQKVIGIGKLVADSSVAAGHLTVVVGTDMPAGGVATGSGATSTPPTTSTPPATTSALPADTINAANAGCID